MLVVTASPEKKAEPIDVPFGMWSQVGPRNHVLDEGADPTEEGAVFGGRRDLLIAKYRWLVGRLASPFSINVDFIIYYLYMTFIINK